MRAASGPLAGGSASRASSGGSSGASNRRSIAAQYGRPRRRDLYDPPMVDALQEETADVLGRLIRFNTVNPPGEERERPNLVATLEGAEPVPVLGYLSHVDTVLADAEDWTHDPWSGEVHDGHVWGRGALDMKSQTAAEVVAAARLAREGWRPERGALKVFSVVDEETGGIKGAKWLCEIRPDLARADFLLNEGAGTLMPY